MPPFWKPPSLPLTDVFIETGTNRGDSLAVAAGMGYPACLSVEFVDVLFRLAQERFANHPRIRLFHGSSPEMLPKMIDPAKNTTFWLDAHYCGNDKGFQDPRFGECPLLKELEVIMAADWRQPPIICIDDAFIFREDIWNGPSWIFTPQLFTRSQWPLLADIAALLPGYEIREENYVLFCVKKLKNE